jgi:hypothetical protein
VAIDPQIQVSIEQHALARDRPDQRADDLVTLAVVLKPETNPPAGEVRHGSSRWRFSNRVELLEAVDAASQKAQEKDSQ